MLNQKRSTRFLLCALLTAGMSIGMCTPALAVKPTPGKRITEISSDKVKYPIFSPEGRKEMRTAILAGALTGTIRSILTIYLNDRLVTANKAASLPFINALLVLLEMYILKKNLNNPRGLPLTAVAASAFASAITLNAQPKEWAKRSATLLFDPPFKTIGWLFSRCTTPQPGVTTPQLPTPVVPAPVLPTPAQ